MTSNYTQFTNMEQDILSSNKISLKAKGIYFYLLVNQNSKQFSIAKIADESKDCKPSINKGIQELEKLGLLSRVLSKDLNGKYKGCDYSINKDFNIKNI